MSLKESFNESIDEEDEKDFWSGKGHIEFFVLQNTPKVFEIELLDYSGCAGGMEEVTGIEYYISECWGIADDPSFKLREGVSYIINGLTVQWYQGDGWMTDNDVEYDFEEITVAGSTTLWEYLSYKAKLLWWRHVQSRLANKKGKK